MLPLAGTNTTELIKSVLFDKNIYDPKNTEHVLLPNNDKSMLENVLRRNMYRSDLPIVENLAGLISETIKK